MMRSSLFGFIATAMLFVSSLAAQVTQNDFAARTDAVQPAREALDLAMYGRIRDESFTRSRIMDYAVALFDDIGPRLTGSPNMARANAWTRVVTPKADFEKLSAYFNIDNGGGKLLGVYAEGNTAIVPIFEEWITPLKDLGVTAITLRPSGSSDLDSFEDAGIPSFQFIQDPRDYGTRSVHTNQDTYERLSPEDLKQAAVVEAVFLYNAAMRDQMLPRKVLLQPPPSSLTPVILPIPDTK
ncbi:M28 family peptidase [Granulicella arctica]|uniref:Carboxypeptidase Q n=1 Tax=Granulicella arctica TaxID=940613 RepID=A0A7Y9PIZ7_9BACT|nr:M28 family peptidase [Granulicella arctica]NYF80624.1 hypothetical protein [Granulicella arctica]